LCNRLVAAAEEQQRTVSGEMRYRLVRSFEIEDEKVRAITATEAKEAAA
jgi:hypothetical protein